MFTLQFRILSYPGIGLVESPKNKLLIKEASPIARRSTSVPATARVLEEAAFLRTVTSGGRINQRRHNFSQKTIIKSENCFPCGNRCVMIAIIW